MIESIFLVIMLIAIYITTMKRPKNYPPGPMTVPLLGNYNYLLNEPKPQSTFVMFHKKFGEIVGLVFPNFKVIVLNGVKACKEAFMNEDCLGRPDVCLVRDRFEGQNFGVLFTDGEGWKSQRRFIIHNFKNLGFGRQDHETIVINEAEALVEEILSKKGKPFSLEEYFSMVSINITWALLGSKRYDYSDPALKALVGNIKKSIHGVKCFGSIACLFPFIRYLLPRRTGYTGIATGSKGIIEFVQKAIKEHVATREAGFERDFIDNYLQELENVKENDHFSEEQLEGICMDMLCAGADTTSAVMGYSILFMCLNKGLQEEVYREIKEQIGDSVTPTELDRAKIPLCEATIMEVVRFRTPAPTVLPHRVTRDTTLCGYNIPKDAILIINLHSIFMEKEYWGDPETFRPARFLTEDGKFQKDERMMAFGKGKRSCLGEALAKMTALIVFTTLIQRFSFSIPSTMPVPDTEGVPGFTTAPPLFHVIATPRNENNNIC